MRMPSGASGLGTVALTGKAPGCGTAANGVASGRKTPTPRPRYGKLKRDVVGGGGVGGGGAGEEAAGGETRGEGCGRAAGGRGRGRGWGRRPQPPARGAGAPSRPAPPPT